eukprot:snap_masked-scaffold_45-processed-gene-1.49-mRNA-1 protein AED:1.00 eAED:1.00 QI:0/0/0/0/1/1/3/0/1071
MSKRKTLVGSPPDDSYEDSSKTNLFKLNSSSGKIKRSTELSKKSRATEASSLLNKVKNSKKNILEKPNTNIETAQVEPSTPRTSLRHSGSFGFDLSSEKHAKNWFVQKIASERGIEAPKTKEEKQLARKSVQEMIKTLDKPKKINSSPKEKPVSRTKELTKKFEKKKTKKRKVFKAKDSYTKNLPEKKFQINTKEKKRLEMLRKKHKNTLKREENVKKINTQKPNSRQVKSVEILRPKSSIQRKGKLEIGSKKGVKGNFVEEVVIKPEKTEQEEKKTSIKKPQEEEEEQGIVSRFMRTTMKRKRTMKRDKTLKRKPQLPSSPPATEVEVDSTPNQEVVEESEPEVEEQVDDSDAETAIPYLQIEAEIARTKSAVFLPPETDNSIKNFISKMKPIRQSNKRGIKSPTIPSDYIELSRPQSDSKPQMKEQEVEESVDVGKPNEEKKQASYVEKSPSEYTPPQIGKTRSKQYSAFSAASTNHSFWNQKPTRRSKPKQRLISNQSRFSLAPRSARSSTMASTVRSLLDPYAYKLQNQKIPSDTLAGGYSLFNFFSKKKRKKQIDYIKTADEFFNYFHYKPLDALNSPESFEPVLTYDVAQGVYPLDTTAIDILIVSCRLLGAYRVQFTALWSAVNKVLLVRLKEQSKLLNDDINVNIMLRLNSLQASVVCMEELHSIHSQIPASLLRPSRNFVMGFLAKENNEFEDSLTRAAFDVVKKLQKRLFVIIKVENKLRSQNIGVILVEGKDWKCGVCKKSKHQNDKNEIHKDYKFQKRLESCEHCFHKGCIDDWSREHYVCPVCNVEIAETKQINFESFTKVRIFFVEFLYYILFLYPIISLFFSGGIVGVNLLLVSFEVFVALNIFDTLISYLVTFVFIGSIVQSYSLKKYYGKKEYESQIWIAVPVILSLIWSPFVVFAFSGGEVAVLGKHLEHSWQDSSTLGMKLYSCYWWLLCSPLYFLCFGVEDDEIIDEDERYTSFEQAERGEPRGGLTPNGQTMTYDSYKYTRDSRNFSGFTLELNQERKKPESTISEMSQTVRNFSSEDFDYVLESEDYDVEKELQSLQDKLRSERSGDIV